VSAVRSARIASIFAVALSLGTLALPRVVHAQAVQNSQQALSREQFEIGVRAAEAQRWPEAVRAFERAYALVPSAGILLNLATSLVESGRLVDGAEAYRRFLRIATSGAAFERRGEAEAALADIERRIGHARLDVVGLVARDRVLLDGQVLASAALNMDLPVDPGSHVVRVERSGSIVAERRFAMQQAETHTVHIVAPPPPRDVSHRPAPSVFASPWFWTITGVLVAGGVATGVFLWQSNSAQPQGTLSPSPISL
jgi:hypothetical protein